MEGEQGLRDVAGVGLATPASNGRDTKVKAIILAAGRGSRLGEAGDCVPKCLLEVGRRRLVEYQLDMLAEAGIGPVALVVGYAADEVREVVGMRAEYLVNTRWEGTNSLYSFWLAREWINGPVVILNSDVLFSPLVLERLLEIEGDTVAIDSGSGRGREQMKVRVVKGRLEDMRKDLSADESSGENVGILKLTVETAQALQAEARRLVEAGEHKAWLSTAVREVARDRPIRAVDVAGTPWVEIDFPTDLMRARKEVLPAIRRAESRRPTRRLFWIAAIPVLACVPFLPQLTRPQPPERPQRSWAVVLPDASERVSIRHGELRQSWWMLTSETAVSCSVAGPSPVRIDSRLLDPDAELTHYVLDLTVDGERVDWFTCKTRVSNMAKHPDFAVGRRERITIDLEPGAHEITVSLVAPIDARCLVRVRLLEPGIED